MTEAPPRKRLQIDFDDVDLWDVRPLQPRSAADSLQRLESAVRAQYFRYRRRGGDRVFVVHSVPSQNVVVVFRKE